jgi:hypothetical protein
MAGGCLGPPAICLGRGALRCWRTGDLPGTDFYPELPGGGAQGEGMLTYDDILEGLGRIPNAELARARHARIEIGRAPQHVAWDTAFVEIEISLPREAEDAVARALEVAMGEVNALVDSLA